MDDVNNSCIINSYTCTSLYNIKPNNSMEVENGLSQDVHNPSSTISSSESESESMLQEQNKNTQNLPTKLTAIPSPHKKSKNKTTSPRRLAYQVAIREAIGRTGVTGKKHDRMYEAVQLVIESLSLPDNLNVRHQVRLDIGDSISNKRTYKNRRRRRASLKELQISDIRPVHAEESAIEVENNVIAEDSGMVPAEETGITQHVTADHSIQEENRMAGASSIEEENRPSRHINKENKRAHKRSKPARVEKKKPEK